MPKFIIFQEQGVWTWVLVDPDGRTVAKGENYGTEAHAHHVVDAVKKMAKKAATIVK